MTVPKPDSVPRKRLTKDGGTTKGEHGGDGGLASRLAQLIGLRPVPFLPASACLPLQILKVADHLHGKKIGMPPSQDMQTMKKSPKAEAASKE